MPCQEPGDVQGRKNISTQPSTSQDFYFSTSGLCQSKYTTSAHTDSLGEAWMVGRIKDSESKAQPYDKCRSALGISSMPVHKMFPPFQLSCREYVMPFSPLHRFLHPCNEIGNIPVGCYKKPSQLISIHPVARPAQPTLKHLLQTLPCNCNRRQMSRSKGFWKARKQQSRS